MTVEQVKEKLKTHTGTGVGTMLVYLVDREGRMVAELSEEHRKLGFFSPEDGFGLHVVDTDPHSASANGWLEDTSKVTKYVMPDEEYDKRENTFRKWCQQKRKEEPGWTLEKEMARRRGQPEPEPKQPASPDFQAEHAEAIRPGMRCEVSPGAKRGTVRVVGNEMSCLPAGWWVGVEYDEPVGKNDGSIKGHRHFNASPNFGGFVRPANVAIGDFPPVDDEFPDEI